MSETLYSGEVARRLGVSQGRVHQLDNELRPRRAVLGVRLYDPAVVDRFEAERRTQREARRLR